MGSIVDRLEQFRQEKNLKKNQFAQALGVSNAHYAQILTGRNKVSAEHMGNLYAFFGDEIDLNWILSGKKDETVKLIIDNNGHPVQVDVSHVSAELADELYHKVRSSKSELPLNYQQELKFRSACSKAIAENPDANLEELSIAGRVYLDYILRYPDLEIF